MNRFGITVAFIALLQVLLGCSVSKSECRLPNQDEWGRLQEAPWNLAEVLSSSEPTVVESLSGSRAIDWYERADGSFASCELGADVGTCGQDVYVFLRTEDGWSAGRYYAKLCFE